MEQQSQESTLPAALLAELVGLCKKDGLVRELAESLHLTRQTIYLWDKQDGECLTYRAAKLRLLEVSRIVEPKLSTIVRFAAAALSEVEANERQTKEGAL